MEGIQNRIKGKDFITPQCKGKFGVHTDGGAICQLCGHEQVS